MPNGEKQGEAYAARLGGYLPARAGFRGAGRVFNFYTV